MLAGGLTLFDNQSNLRSTVLLELNTSQVPWKKTRDIELCLAALSAFEMYIDQHSGSAGRIIHEPLHQTRLRLLEVPCHD
ncbi:hypothetical protein D3C76_1155440 [compost metagenome]